MSVCEIEVAFAGDRNKLVSDLKEAVHRQGGIFSGDDNSGSFRISNPFKFEGEYEFKPSKLSVSK